MRTGKVEEPRNVQVDLRAAALLVGEADGVVLELDRPALEQ
eukprot:COSAG04_NODE_16073_length_510_cov_1.335766_1_plen_40_part_10